MESEAIRGLKAVYDGLLSFTKADGRELAHDGFFRAERDLAAARAAGDVDELKTAQTSFILHMDAVKVQQAWATMAAWGIYMLLGDSADGSSPEAPPTIDAVVPGVDSIRLSNAQEQVAAVLTAALTAGRPGGLDEYLALSD